jgi:selT/selW/selH-like putative selenoprotein
MMRRIVAVSMLVLLLALVLGAVSAFKGKTSHAQDIVSIEIYHCTTCGFRSKAEDVAKALKKEYGVEADIRTGDTGSFDVYVNGELIFSRFEEGRFPENEELVEIIDTSF